MFGIITQIIFGTYHKKEIAELLHIPVIEVSLYKRGYPI